MRFAIIFLLSLTFLATLGCCRGDGENWAYKDDERHGGYEGGNDMHVGRHGYYGSYGVYGKGYGSYGGYGKGYGGYGSGYKGGKGPGGKDDDIPNNAVYAPYPMSSGPPLSALLAANHYNDKDTMDVLWQILWGIGLFAVLYYAGFTG